MNDELEVCVALQTERNSMVSGLHKPRGYAQGLLIEAECVDGVNKLPCGVKWRDRGQASNWVPKRSRPNVAETRLDAAEGSNRGSRRRGVKRLDALTHTAIAYAATSP
jgi:hypothetical protein